MFENISIGVRTFLRDECLFNTLHAIRTNLPGAQIIVADCGDMTEEKDGLYAELEREGHIHIDLPFDAGFGRMSNEIAKRVTRPYYLIGSDDFDFAPIEVLLGIEKMQNYLDNYRSTDIVAGRVNNHPYEFHLIERQPGEWYERPLTGAEYFTSHTRCDLTVNYLMMRNRVLDAVRWDDDVKIGGGEHAAFFIDCKKAGLVIDYLPGVNINEQQIRNGPRYNMYRRRAQDPERPCFVKRGIKRYVMGNGVVDYAVD